MTICVNQFQRDFDVVNTTKTFSLTIDFTDRVNWQLNRHFPGEGDDHGESVMIGKGHMEETATVSIGDCVRHVQRQTCEVISDHLNLIGDHRLLAGGHEDEHNDILLVLEIRTPGYDVENNKWNTLTFRGIVQKARSYIES